MLSKSVALRSAGFLISLLSVAGPLTGCSGEDSGNGSAESAAETSATITTNSVKGKIQSSAQTAPAIVLTTPAQDSTAVGTMAISGTAPGYLNVEVSFNGTLLGRTTPATSGAFNVSINTANLPNGIQVLELNAWNSPAGQPYTLTTQASLSLQVTNSTASVAATPTLYDLSIVTPAANTTVSGTVLISGSALGFLNVEAHYNGMLLGRTTPSISGTYSLTANLLGVQSGAIAVTLNAWDSPAGEPYAHTSQKIVLLLVAGPSVSPIAAPIVAPVTVPAPVVVPVSSGASPVAPVAAPVPTTVVTPPTYKLTVVSPAQNSTVGGALMIKGTAPGFLNVEASFGGILLGRASPTASGSFSMSISTMSLPEGTQTLVLNGWDSPAGQSFSHTDKAVLNVGVANGSVKITDFGALPDGISDNFAAITNAIAAAKSKGVSVFIPAGTFAYGSVINLTGVKMFGVGDASVLYAQDWSHESIFMYGDGAEVRQLKLTGVTPPGRVAPWEATRITLFGATHFVIDHVTILDSAAAGIQTATSANNGKITNNTVMNTLSDSIHITDKASYITLENNHVENSGDDGIAVVSYLNDGDYVSNITARNNTVINNKWGRNMSVVGGKNIVYENNDLENNVNWACLYLAQEGSYNTFGDVNVTAQFNTLKSCGNQADGHAAIMLITTGSGQNVTVNLIRNDIVQTGNAGIRVFGANVSATLDSNRVTGAVPSLIVDSPGVVVTPYITGLVGCAPFATDPIP